MLGLVTKLQDTSKFDNIVLILFSIFALRVFGYTTSLEDLTFRLPRDVRPISYFLQLHPDFDTELFNGEVVIAIEILCVRRFIVLHAKDLTIEAIRISLVEQFNDTTVAIGDLVPKRISMIDKFEMILVETSEVILPGCYELRMKFNGTMANKNRGFFITSYVDPDTGFTRKIVTTRFQPTHARRVFPCFDEPGFKSIFNIRLIQPNIDGYHSLSNMPREVSISGVPRSGLTTVEFEPSLPMSTHLVTFVISDFVHKTAFVANICTDDHAIPIRAWTTDEKMFSTDFVLYAVYHSINVCIRLFGAAYPLPKIDLVAVPTFPTRTNENWGLIKLDEAAVLFYDRANSISDLKISANRITNALVHVWFGNLVTMEWWSDFWFIESFAIYMQYYITDAIFPDWKETGNFVIDAKYPSMTKDALSSAEPIVQPFDTIEKIEHLFDTMPDRKGASIIRMLHYMMGERNFFKAVASYLQIYQHRATVTIDFINCLKEYYTQNDDLFRFVDTWTKQSGFPVLNVIRRGNLYVFNQTRFSMNNVTTGARNDSPYSYKWDLPILYTTNLDNSPKILFLSCDTEEGQLTVDEEIRWVKFNTNSVGYYTVNYDEQTWKDLSMFLRTQPEKFGMLDRTDLLNDAFVNADADTLPYDVPMNMLDHMKSEIEYTPWQIVCDKLLKMHTSLRGTLILRKFEGYSNFCEILLSVCYSLLLFQLTNTSKVFVRTLIKPIYLSTGWYAHPLDTFELRRLRMIILKTACVIGLKDCHDNVTQRFRNWIKSPNRRPHPDIRDIVYYYGMQLAGNHINWNTVFNLFIAEDNLQERYKLMISLTAVQNASLMVNYLEKAKDPRVMNPEEYLATIRAATLNPIGLRIIWDFYRINWKFLTSRYSRNDLQFARLIIPISSRFRTAYRFTELRNFFDKYPYGTLSADARREVLEIVQNNAVWLQRNYNEIKVWLDAYSLQGYP